MARVEGNSVVLDTEEENRVLLEAIKADLGRKLSDEDEEEIKYSMRLYRSLMSQ